MEDDVTARAHESVTSTLHALEVFMLTEPRPEPDNEDSLKVWAVKLAGCAVMASSPVIWQAAIESTARAFEAHPRGLNLTPAQSAEAGRWLRTQDVTE
jgi:hypothetical protein